jgi:hypothetical protein
MSSSLTKLIATPLRPYLHPAAVATAAAASQAESDDGVRSQAAVT